MKKIIVLISLFSIANAAFSQQAWTKKKGEGYFQIGFSSLNYSQIYDDSFKTSLIPRPITETIFSFYGEYGITDRLMLNTSLPYHILSSGELDTAWNTFAPEKGTLNALGNTEIALTYNFYNDKGVVLSSKLNFSGNTVEIDQSTGLRTGFNAYSVTPLILAGIGKKKYFASAETGVKFYSGQYLNRFVFNAQIGKRLLKSKKLLFIFSALSNTALGNSSSKDILELDNTASYTGLYLNEQSYYAANIKFGYEFLQEWAVWISMGGGIGKNLGQNAVYSLSIGYNLKHKKTNK